MRYSALFPFWRDKMKTLKTIEKRVTEILTEYPEARNDDMRLYLLVSQSCIYETHGIGTVTFEDVMTNYKGYGIPCFETVSYTHLPMEWNKAVD